VQNVTEKKPSKPSIEISEFTVSAALLATKTANKRIVRRPIII